jgi:hypothetical protein
VKAKRRRDLGVLKYGVGYDLVINRETGRVRDSLPHVSTDFLFSEGHRAAVLRRVPHVSRGWTVGA